MENSNVEKKNEKLGYIGLTGVSIGTTIGAGIFALSRDMVAGGANTAGVLAGWIVCGIGMLGLIMCFFGLNRQKPKLTGGIYTYAQAGWGDYVGFNTTYGYWWSVVLCNVTYATLLFAALGHFFPVFEEGNNLASIIGASIFFWFLFFLVASGIRNASFVNLVVAIAKIIPILVFIIAAVLLQHFHWEIFIDNFWGSPEIPFLAQIKSTTAVTVWAFIGIEGAIAVSEHAKNYSDVGRAVLTSFFSVLGLYIVVSMLSMGLMPQEELKALGNPPLAYLLEMVVGPWGAYLINFGVVAALSGAALGCTLISSHIPSGAATKGYFLQYFAKKNKNGIPINALLVSTLIVQGFLIVTYYSASTYQIFFRISAGMIMIPYFLSALYYFKVAYTDDADIPLSANQVRMRWVFSIIGTLYGVWMLYSLGDGLLRTTLLYAPATILYFASQKEKGKSYFANKWEVLLFIAIWSCAAVTAWLIASGSLKLLG